MRKKRRGNTDKNRVTIIGNHSQDSDENANAGDYWLRLPQHKACEGGGRSTVVWSNSKQAQTRIIRESDRSAYNEHVSDSSAAKGSWNAIYLADGTVQIVFVYLGLSPAQVWTLPVRVMYRQLVVTRGMKQPFQLLHQNHARSRKQHTLSDSPSHNTNCNEVSDYFIIFRPIHYLRPLAPAPSCNSCNSDPRSASTGSSAPSAPQYVPCLESREEFRNFFFLSAGVELCLTTLY